MNNLIAIEMNNIGDDQIQTVNARELHAFLENKDMFANWIRDRIQQYDFEEGQDYVTYLENPKKGRPRTEYALSIDMAKELSMVERNAKGKQAREYFIACERQAKAVISIPDFSNPAAAARAWAEQYEARQIAERTKAEIGSRREATAMATASQAVRKANKLEQQLDQSQQYASVKRMSMLYHGQQFNWRELKQASKDMALPPIDVFDANYGTVKAYHADVWQEAYAIEIPLTGQAA